MANAVEQVLALVNEVKEAQGLHARNPKTEIPGFTVENDSNDDSECYTVSKSIDVNGTSVLVAVMYDAAQYGDAGDATHMPEYTRVSLGGYAIMEHSSGSWQYASDAGGHAGHFVFWDRDPVQRAKDLATVCEHLPDPNFWAAVTESIMNTPM